MPSAKKHAGRARQRLDGSQDASLQAGRPDQQVAEAFTAAARTGYTRRMLQLLAPDCVRDAEAALLPPGARTTVVGALDIATETAHHRDRIQAACRIVLNGEPMYLIAPGGHPLATIGISTAEGKVTKILLRSARADDDFARTAPSPAPAYRRRDP
ncbi:hypothetical protein ACIOG7_36420 [Streptomyces sp. NPDC087894]|uniref:hypothetical protein n=1 Tax=Streptomyces sp. NPDC087894 TaxID=3365816 RepID=UPI0037FBD28D